MLEYEPTLVTRGDKVVRLEATIRNPFGFHARPSAFITKLSSQYSGEVYLTNPRMQMRESAKNVMNVLMMECRCGDRVLFEINTDNTEPSYLAAEELARKLAWVTELDSPPS